MPKPEIDLSRVAGNGDVRNLAGKPRGEAARLELEVDRLDETTAPVPVVVPDYIYAISTSFFLGLFSGSLDRFKSAEAFLAHYHFHADENVMKQVLHGIDRALAERDAHHRMT